MCNFEATRTPLYIVRYLTDKMTADAVKDLRACILGITKPGMLCLSRVYFEHDTTLLIKLHLYKNQLLLVLHWKLSIKELDLQSGENVMNL